MKIALFSLRQIILGGVLFLALLGAGTFVVELQPVSRQLNDHKSMVIIDPGHGGYDPGASWGAQTEARLSLELARGLRDYLVSDGYQVVLTRNRDTGLSNSRVSLPTRKLEDLQFRAALAAQHSPSILISIHTGSHSREDYAGPRTYYNATSEAGRQLAGAIQTELANVWPGDCVNLPQPGQHFLLTTAKFPAVVIDAGFLSNATDRVLLQNSGFKQEVARAICRGIQAEAGPDAGAGPAPIPFVSDTSPPAGLDNSMNLDIYPVYFESAGRLPGSLQASRRVLPQTMEVWAMSDTHRQASLLTDQASSLVNEVIKGPEAGTGMDPVVPSNARVNSVVKDGALLKVDFSRELADAWDNNVFDEAVMANALVQTLRELPGVMAVQFTLEGETEVSLGGHLHFGQLYQ